jgi:hypothetical protein
VRVAVMFLTGGFIFDEKILDYFFQFSSYHFVGKRIGGLIK